MIRYFLLDLDGCLTRPFQTPDWQAVTAIRDLQIRSEDDKTIPALSLCTGRPLPYAEAVAQWMGIRDLVIFESGGGFFHPVTNKLIWSPHFTPEIARKSKELRAWFTNELLPRYPDMLIEFTKHTDVGMVHTDPVEIEDVYEIACFKVEQQYPEFEVHRTDVSVNIILRECNKASGLRFFADYYGITSDELAYIGDSTGDLMALKWAGTGFAPANAVPEVKKQAHVTREEATLGVLEAYRMLIDINKIKV